MSTCTTVPLLHLSKMLGSPGSTATQVVAWELPSLDPTYTQTPVTTPPGTALRRELR